MCGYLFPQMGAHGGERDFLHWGHFPGVLKNLKIEKKMQGDLNFPKSEMVFSVHAQRMRFPLETSEDVSLASCLPSLPSPVLRDAPSSALSLAAPHNHHHHLFLPPFQITLLTWTERILQKDITKRLWRGLLDLSVKKSAFGSCMEFSHTPTSAFCKSSNSNLYCLGILHLCSITIKMVPTAYHILEFSIHQYLDDYRTHSCSFKFVSQDAYPWEVVDKLLTIRQVAASVIKQFPVWLRVG